MSIVDLNKLALDLVARDYSDGHAASQPGPTKTSRALAIIHMAARDAYAKVTGAYPAKLAGLPAKPGGLGSTDKLGQDAAAGAVIAACNLLYPDSAAFITAAAAILTSGADPTALNYGKDIGNAWFVSRLTDMSYLPQTDAMYSDLPGRHRADPVNPGQMTLGRKWGMVTPFILTNVATEAPLGPPDALPTAAYATAYDEVFERGRDNITERKEQFRHHAAVGIFWGYDGSNKLGTPPRLYNQVVVATKEFQVLGAKDQLNVLAAIHAAMADAGIAAWHWKYVYDFWRPVVAIREADAGWGPTGTGDGTPHGKYSGDPFWLPLGAPRSNPIAPLPAGATGYNFTPNFPAYPSGHATFGTACFLTFAKLVNIDPKKIILKFVSDEFTGKQPTNMFNPGTTDNHGILRPRWEQEITLEAAIKQNKESRIFLGVHWRFDADGGGKVGEAIAKIVFNAFK